MCGSLTGHLASDETIASLCSHHNETPTVLQKMFWKTPVCLVGKSVCVCLCACEVFSALFIAVSQLFIYDLKNVECQVIKQ